MKKAHKIKIPLHIYISFTITIFISSFLLFQIQPIISKYILPWFGGASAVWITAMLFFQTLLLFGYYYVYAISLISLKKQILMHGIIIFLAGFAVYNIINGSQIPVLPAIETRLSDDFPPVLQVLWVLFLGTGITYFLLSTTSILLQKWFGTTHQGKSPYIFYSLSNIASLLALVSYPFLVEPFIQLKTQGIIWSAGYIIYSIFLLICCIQIYYIIAKARKREYDKLPVKNKLPGFGSNEINSRTKILWILLPALSSLMLLSTTNLITQSITPVPFLWILPLCLYLISFILSFAGSRWYSRKLYAVLSLIMGLGSVAFILGNMPSFAAGIIIYSIMLFSACMLCHGELYTLRPQPAHLDLYYLNIALGSAISGIFVGIIAPIYFKAIWEIWIGFYLTFLLTVWIIIHNKNTFSYRHLKIFFTSDKEILIFASIVYPLSIFLTSFILNYTSGNNLLTMKTWRNFYGVISVKHNTKSNMNVLVYGNVIHGGQYNDSNRKKPVTYYGEKTGIGITFKNVPQLHQKINMGVIGLGTGTLAAFGKKGDEITFFEINPLVMDIANSNFTYLKDSKAEIKLVLGDGRLSLEKEIKAKKPKYDIIIIDAFSDDSIPLHLLTKEAFRVYLDRLKIDKGIIAVNISNRYIDLKPILIQQTKTYGLKYASFFNGRGDKFNTPSEWALLSNDAQLFQIPAIAKAAYVNHHKYKPINLWTDNYSNLFQILK